MGIAIVSGTNTKNIQMTKASVMRKVGYYTEHDNLHFSLLNSIEFGKLTHVIYSGIWCNTDTDPSIRFDSSVLPGVQAKCKAAGVKFITSLAVVVNNGAWTGLTNIMENPTTRAQLVTNLVNFVNSQGVDGIDLDWEPFELAPADPTIEPAIHSFLTQLRAALPAGKIISVAMPAAIDYHPWVDAVQDSPLVGFFNVMLYDMAEPADAIYTDFVHYSQVWLSKGFPASKLNLGIPVYASGANGGITAYRQVLAEYNPATSVNQLSVTSVWGWDTTNTPVPVPGGVLWWNGYDLAVQKTQWAMANGIGGMMFWAIDYDMVDDSRSLVRAVYNTIGS